MKKAELAEWCEAFCDELGDDNPLVTDFREHGGGEDVEYIERPRHLDDDLVAALYKYSQMPWNEFTHIRDEELDLTKTQYANVAKLAFWELLEPDGGGYWRVTQHGIDWLRGKVKVRQTAITVRGKGCVRLEGPLVGPRDVGPWEGREKLIEESRLVRGRPA